jgi:hypothetical protein
MTVKLSPSDVGPEVAAGKTDALRTLHAPTARLREAVSDGGDRAHAAAGRRELA